MPEHAGGVGYEDEEMVLYKDDEACPRCNSLNVAEITPNSRKKDRRCIECKVIWDHEDPENTWSIIGL